MNKNIELLAGRDSGKSRSTRVWLNKGDISRFYDLKMKEINSKRLKEIDIKD